MPSKDIRRAASLIVLLILILITIGPGATPLRSSETPTCASIAPVGPRPSCVATSGQNPFDVIAVVVNKVASGYARAMSQIHRVSAPWSAFEAVFTQWITSTPTADANERE